jgi:hypothetical protein
MILIMPPSPGFSGPAPPATHHAKASTNRKVKAELVQSLHICSAKPNPQVPINTEHHAHTARGQGIMDSGMMGGGMLAMGVIWLLIAWFSSSRLALVKYLRR